MDKYKAGDKILLNPTQRGEMSVRARKGVIVAREPKSDVLHGEPAYTVRLDADKPPALQWVSTMWESDFRPHLVNGGA